MVYHYDQDIKVKQVASEKILKKKLGKNFLALDESLCFIVIQYQSYLIHTTRTIQGVNGISL